MDFEDIKGYNNNPNLPRPDAQVQLTGHELDEYVKCAADPFYFINEYVKIVHVDRGIVPFKMWNFQEQLIQTFEDNRFVICKMARQSGKSTVVVCGYFLWYITFHTDVSVCILANKENTAIELLTRLKQSYELLPMFLKQGVKKWDQKMIRLANGARVRAEATSASSIRGDTFNIMFLDEFAHVADNIANEFTMSVFPAISSGKTTKLFIISTPKGYNLFWKIWNEATLKENGFINIGFTWRDVPDRDAKWAEETRRMMGSDQAFEQEHECDFMGSANTLIPKWKLSQLTYSKPVETREHLKIYVKPIKGEEKDPAHIYVATIDTSQGMEQDYTVMSVFDISLSPFRQVAVYRQNNITPQLFSPIARDVARYYNSAYVLCEINDVGLTVADTLLMELEYENLITIRSHPKKGQMLSGGFNPKARLGLRQTIATKRIGCSSLRAMVEKDQLLVSDFDTLQELTTFVMSDTKTKNGTYEAESGHHDDCCMTLVLFGWLTAQSHFENYVGLSMRKLLINSAEVITLEAPPEPLMDVSVSQRPAWEDPPPNGMYHIKNEYDKDFWGS